VLRVPIIQVVLERGAFTHDTTLAVANVTLISLIGPFICGGLGNVIWKGFYISQKTKLASLLGVTHTLIYISLAYFLAKSFSYLGLAWASTIQYVIGILMGMIAMKLIYKGISGRKILAGLVAILMSSLLSGMLVQCCFNLLPSVYSLPLRVITAGCLGVIAYIWLTVYIFRLDEAVSLKAKVVGTVCRKVIIVKKMFFAGSNRRSNLGLEEDK